MREKDYYFLQLVGKKSVDLWTTHQKKVITRFRQKILRVMLISTYSLHFPPCDWRWGWTKKPKQSRCGRFVRWKTTSWLLVGFSCIGNLIHISVRAGDWWCTDWTDPSTMFAMIDDVADEFDGVPVHSRSWVWKWSWKWWSQTMRSSRDRSRSWSGHCWTWHLSRSKINQLYPTF